MTGSATVPFDTTLHVRDTCLCLYAQRAARVLARHFDEALRPAGLTNTQFSLMMALNRPKPPSMTDVAALLGADRTTLTAAMKPLRRRGLVTVAGDEVDGRIRRLRLTDAGHARLATALPYWTRTHAALDAALEAAGPTRLRQDLKLVATLCRSPRISPAPNRPETAS